MLLDDRVRVYDAHDWFSEGRITSISADRVEVDFLDWKAEYLVGSLKLNWIFYTKVWIAPNEGIILQDFRN